MNSEKLSIQNGYTDPRYWSNKRFFVYLNDLILFRIEPPSNDRDRPQMWRIDAMHPLCNTEYLHIRNALELFAADQYSDMHIGEYLNRLFGVEDKCTP